LKTSFPCSKKEENKETAEKPPSERLMENVHPADFAAGRNPEE
jgi:hypothetical protein